jgi:hypothetical protein
MTAPSQGRPQEQTIAAIQALDLTPIKFKATRKEGGYGWSAAYADEMEAAYKRYLTLHAKHPELTLAPDEDVDRFWHMHILDTRKYAADCEATFGHFLHHYPYLGLRGERDVEVLEAAHARMRQLQAQEFGEPQARQGQPAWCSVEPGKAAAWCSVEPGKAAAAWCSVEPGTPRAAWCSGEPSASSPAWGSVELRAKAGSAHVVKAA